ncbi:uncharacterized protein LOC127627658 isoform X2 [Xyrauchen texanus]|uniref:uncharacterized protein LOC127627658 isoform X2 n=1 Tax=Xyrauchen texanus TaxID=154827 RepID=UPI00224206FD|nr:uncharacterized protein LOC127627658 isoform X2 [Xyrauchen texanus]
MTSGRFDALAASGVNVRSLRWFMSCWVTLQLSRAAHSHQNHSWWLQVPGIGQLEFGNSRMEKRSLYHRDTWETWPVYVFLLLGRWVLIDIRMSRPFFRKTPSTSMALAKSVYNLLFRRTSTFAISIMVGAVFFERMFDQGGDAIFENINRGKLWKHIKHNYEEKEE